MTKEWTHTDAELGQISIIARRNQRNLRLRIKGEKITVSAPLLCSKKEIIRFIESHTDWALKTLSRQRKKKDKISGVLENRDGYLLVRGEWKKLEFRKNGKYKDGIVFNENGQTITYEAAEPLSDVARLKKIANLWLKDLAKIELKIHFIKKSGELPFEWKKIFIRSQSTKWGTCSSLRNISLNWRIIKTPPAVWDYLIVHELCHTVHMNHSKDFWNLVEQHYPQRKEAERWMREFETLIFAESEIA